MSPHTQTPKLLVVLAAALFATAACRATPASPDEVDTAITAPAPPPSAAAAEVAPSSTAAAAGLTSERAATIRAAAATADAARQDKTPPAPATAGVATQGGTPPVTLPDDAATQPSGADAVKVIEDWSGYPDADALDAAFDRNLGWVDNQLTLAALPAAQSPDGGPGARLAYDILKPAPNDYVGIERTLWPAQDWSGYKWIDLAVSAEGSMTEQLVLQWREGSGEVWRQRVSIKGLPTSVLSLALDGAGWEWADWSTKENGHPDLGAVDQWSLFVGHGGAGEGALRLGRLRLLGSKGQR